MSQYADRARIILAFLIIAAGAGPMSQAQEPAIRVVLLGTSGGPNTNATRAGPAALVFAGNERLLFDAGRNVVWQLRQTGMQPGAITRIFLTHLHSDHVIGLPDFWLSGWWMGRRGALEVRGPAGTRAMADGLQRAFAADIDLRTGPPERLSREEAALNGFDVSEGVVYETGGVRVTAITVDHGPVPTFGYRIDYGGRSVVFSGDDRRSDNLIAKSQNVDVLFHNMSAFTDEQLKEDTKIGAVRRAALQLLGTPEDAAEVFSRSRCKVALLIHSPRDEISVGRVRAVYKGRLEVPDDLTEVLIGDEVSVRPLPR